MSAFKPVIVTTTAPTREEAEKIGGLLLEKQLATCVQYEAITSQYLWNGEICRDDEIRITIKTGKGALCHWNCWFASSPTPISCHWPL